MMKKKSISLVFSILLSMSVFCGCSSRFVAMTNYIPEGIFLADDTSGTMLKLTPISEEEYIEADGVNVIEDKSLNPKNKYFSIFLLCCYHKNHPEDFHRVNFYGFRLWTHNDDWCDYLIPTDDSFFGWSLTPYTNGLRYRYLPTFTEETLGDDCIFITFFETPESDEGHQVTFIKPEYYDYDSYYYYYY